MNRLLRLSSQYGRWAMLGAYVLVLALVSIFLSAIEFETPSDLGLSSGEAGSATSFLASALMLALATGVLAAALVEVFKRLSALRGTFQLYELREYLREASLQAEGRPAPEGPEQSSGASPKSTEAAFQEAWAQLEHAFGEVWLTDRRKSRRRELRGYPRRDARYFFDLPLEQLMAQLGGALQIAIGDARRNRALLLCFAGASQQEVVDLATRHGEQTLPEETTSENAAVVQARTVLAERVTRGLDAVQIIIGHRWRWFIRSVAAAVCALIGVVAVEFAGTTGATSILLWLIAAVPGTYFAWFTRDVTSAIERLR
jgi:hypothetical protein